MITRAGGPHADPVLGFYGPHSLMWRINREAVLLGAGPASLLLQVAHPLIAVGVAQHSDFAADPFGRLRRTLATTLDIVFGDGPTAEHAIRRLNGIHAGVRGPSDAEAARLTGADNYRALDPDLLLWVQATLIVTSVEASRRWVGPVTDLEADAFWQEARSVGVRMGIPLRVSPRDWSALLAYWDRMLAPGGPIQVTAEARAMVPMLVRPPLPLAPGWAVDALGLPGLALLPPRIREDYGIAWGAGHERAARLIATGVRAWTSVVPTSLRSMPQARAADRRARRAEAATA
ncbi:MAG: oxygenase MpaB family protein [Candidatus Limnocylindrales bacterium]